MSAIIGNLSPKSQCGRIYKASRRPQRKRARNSDTPSRQSCGRVSARNHRDDACRIPKKRTTYPQAYRLRHFLASGKVFTLNVPELELRKLILMQGTLRPCDVDFLSLQTAVFCVQCELISANNTTRCLSCGSTAVLSLSRVLGGSLKNQQTAQVIADVELDRIVRSLLGSVPQIEEAEARHDLSVIPSFSSRHHLRVRHPRPVPVACRAAEPRRTRS